MSHFDFYILLQKEYDDYISSLLDQQPSRHRLLYEQVEQLSSHGTSNPEVLKDEQKRLFELQESARALLLDNSRYFPLQFFAICLLIRS